MAEKTGNSGDKRLRRIAVSFILVTLVAVLLHINDDKKPDATISEPHGDMPAIIDMQPELIESALSIETAGTVEDSIRFYVSKLSDRSYTETYSDGFIWHIAAEELGMIGLLAIPSLIECLGTDDDYERTQALYALRLAAQHANLREITDGEFVDITPEAFPEPEIHLELVDAWREWYRTYF